jgi:crooked neck
MYLLLEAHPKYQNYLRVAKFEQKEKRYEESRAVLEKGLRDLGELACHEDYFIHFAKFESR